jgi:hypothetical protein
MGWFQKKSAKEVDEHDSPTEPLKDDATVFDPLPDVPMEATIPAQQQPYTPYGPSQYIQGSANQPNPGVPLGTPVPPGAGIPQGWPIDPAANKGSTPQPASAGGGQARTGRHPLPILVGLCFVYFQLLLLARFVLKITGLMADQAWVNGIYGFSEPLVQPFRALWQLVQLQLPAQIEVYTLIAVLVYGLCSRIIVRLLKLLLKAQV